MRVHSVGSFPELVDGPAVAVILEVSIEEAKDMAALLFEEVSLAAGNPNGCKFEGCPKEAGVCGDHHNEMVTRAVDHGNDEVRGLEERIRLLNRAARLVLGSLAAERDGPGDGNGLSPITDSRARALAQLLGDPS